MGYQKLDKTELLSLRAQGLTNKQIAEKLMCGYSTVCSYIGRGHKTTNKNHIIIQKPDEEKSFAPKKVSETLSIGDYVVQIRWFDKKVLFAKKDEPDNFITIDNDQLASFKQVVEVATLYKEGVMIIE